MFLRKNGIYEYFKLESDGSYAPSKLALKLATSDTIDYENILYTKYQEKKSKVLVIFTEQKNMDMKNGKLFSTKNHPVEALVTMLHLKNAGFDFEIATPTGKPVVFEMWAFPEKDQHVQELYKEYKSRFDKPKSLRTFIDTSLTDTKSYAGVFVPGGHGAMLGLPEDENVGKVLSWAYDSFAIHKQCVNVTMPPFTTIVYCRGVFVLNLIILFVHLKLIFFSIFRITPLPISK